MSRNEVELILLEKEYEEKLRPHYSAFSYCIKVLGGTEDKFYREILDDIKFNIKKIYEEWSARVELLRGNK